MKSAGTIKAEYLYSSELKKERADKYISNPKKIINTALIILFYVAAVLLLFNSLKLTVELAEQNDINISLEERLSELSEENSHLKIKYESAIDLNIIEEKAVNELGMQKPSSSQIKHIAPETQDKATVLSTENKAGVSDKISDLISIIRDALL